MSALSGKPVGDFPVVYVDIGDRHIPVDVIPKNTTLREVIRLKESSQMQKVTRTLVNKDCCNDSVSLFRLVG